METHWAALVSAATRSGKRPISGQDSAPFSGVLIPSSSALSRKELSEISPFGMEAARDLLEDTPEEPYEIGGVSRMGSQAAAVETMKNLHLSILRQQVGALEICGSMLDHDMVGRPVLLPVFIGAFRRNDNQYRIIINGQTGAISGDAPLSWVKIVVAVLSVLVVLVLISVGVSS